MAESTPSGAGGQRNRRRRRELHALVRHLFVAFFGAVLALATSYALRKLGY